MNEEFEPTLEIGISGMGMSEEDTQKAVQNIEAADIENGIVDPVQEEPEEVVPEEAKPEGPTAADYVADTAIGLGAGARDIASNIITAPERVIDFFNGEMEEEGKTKEGYQTEWVQFMYGDGDPIETKTWWGGLVRGSTDVLGTIAVTGGFGKAVGLLSKAQKARTLASTLKEGALLGLRYDLVAKNEEVDNLSGIIAKKYPWLDSALATKDTDHPALNKLRHIVEGMGIGAVFDATIFKITPLAKLLAGQAADVGRPIATNIADTGIKAGKEIGDAARRVYDERGALKAAAGEDVAAIRAKFEEFRKSR